MEIRLWLGTDKPNTRIGLSSPAPIVHQSPVSASGQVEGLPTGKPYWIQGFVTTNKEWPQGGGEIQEDGSWKIDAIYLGAVDHRLFFRIFDEKGTMIAQSEETGLRKF